MQIGEKTASLSSNAFAQLARYQTEVQCVYMYIRVRVLACIHVYLNEKSAYKRGTQVYRTTFLLKAVECVHMVAASVCVQRHQVQSAL